jgi:dUTP pyrophosphatase
MVIPGQTVFNKQYVSYILDTHFQVRKSGIYFTLSKIYTFESGGVIDFDTASQKISTRKEMQFNPNFSITLPKGAYYVEFNERVSTPSNVVGIFQPRRDLLKAGSTISAFMINPHYTGNVGAVLNVYNENGITLIKHARLGQWVFFEIEDDGTLV